MFFELFHYKISDHYVVSETFLIKYLLHEEEIECKARSKNTLTPKVALLTCPTWE